MTSVQNGEHGVRKLWNAREREGLAYSNHVRIQGSCARRRRAAAEQCSAGVQQRAASVDVVVCGGLQLGPLQGVDGVQGHAAPHIHRVEPGRPQQQRQIYACRPLGLRVWGLYGLELSPGSCRTARPQGSIWRGVPLALP